jgi:hypothetical protein
MSFCCGASMIGTKGTMKHYHTKVHNVPLLFCPVCQRVEVHYKVEHEYEILAEYSHDDGITDIDFEDFVLEHEILVFDNCVNVEGEDPLEIVQTQIDMSLDLMTMAKALNDLKWEYQLKRRLAVMSLKKDKLMQKKTRDN